MSVAPTTAPQTLPAPPDDGHEEVLDPLTKTERRRIHEALQMRVEPSGDARKERRVDEDNDLEARPVDAERLGHLEVAAQRADRPARTRVEQIGSRPKRCERDAPDQKIEVALVAQLHAEEVERRNPGEPGVAAQKFQIAEQEVEALRPGNRRERQVVSAHAQRDEPRKSDSASVSTSPMTRFTHGDIAKCVDRIAVVYAPRPTNAAWPNDVCPATPVSSTRPSAAMLYKPT
jgi:hypothetical protein